MYLYTDFDQQLINQRVAQFRDQTERYLAGKLSEDEYRPLRLQNGLYVQRYAPMLRIAVPYGLMNSKQLRKIAEVSTQYDRGYAHVSTRQNIQLNWPALEDVPEILAELATVQMHAIQTSGNCIRNTTTDQYAGVVAGEIADPRPTCELIRQWSTFHPEFAFLPRKFKIAVSALEEKDRAATAFHDIGVYIVRNEAGEMGYKIMVGGGLGRTPIIGSVIREFLPREDLIAYLEAVLRVYNLHGRRDNKYKARIKILVKALTPEVFAQKVEAEFEHTRETLKIQPEILKKLDEEFTPFDYQDLEDEDFTALFAEHPKFKQWFNINTHAHKVKGYRIVTISLKRAGIAPGDMTTEEMNFIADLADKYTFGELRTTHEQNIALADVPQKDLFDVWQALEQHNMARAHIGFITDIISCPGGDFCSLANAKSIPIAEAITRRFEDLDKVYDLGHLDLNISGCMNACGHHHVGNIGILGVDKKGAEFYQITLGGNSDHDASIGDILGPSFAAEAVPDVIEEVLNTYLDLRTEGERFVDTYRRVGIQPFKERAYA
ncbi:TPA: nitrite/sulfite reductase [Acinetobacter baumannii]|jgi:sulfite reductase (NADPH) hemoprotein beta-component|uniref:Nitrite/sulfite reductase ferredoxin domain protein n=22 Tax=Acinetobacter baumannii TaxID=470 RepID=D0CDE6_ACIB2|nr:MULTISPECIES: nitrite/sulfite reductase [Acinetobacter]ADX93735.1 sulfite reductase, beta subunit (hemoprotein) [Acinetobacter baumannii TCDC-AB0715]AHX28968.1 sulfite reductase [Acinetobacter baumannii AC12]AHX65827.1 sulfite reductase [Acinetobacter baumannii AC30]EMT86620.1 CysI-like sulfite reductase protein [Acinetobacter baumannii ABNIH5]ETY68798.1 sulfite reductase [Acinetobacter baumannii MDR_MMC4]EXB12541.1 nitrite/Sulfite reductase ferredoxin-like half domain protein [Acinetobact